MSPDLDQFHGIFFEEAEELVETMERELLEMIFDSDDTERVDDVFRAAHSIKGGAATFGFAAIADVTHVMETLLDGVRGGSKEVGRDLIDILLQGVDCVADMLKRSKKGQQLDTERADEVKEALTEFLGSSAVTSDNAGSTDSPAPESEPIETTASTATNTFYIMFKPDPTLFYTGNDPMHILRSLRLLGTLEVDIQTCALPGFENFEADKIYLGWDLVLETKSVEEVVREEFAWVVDVCDLEIKLLHPGEIPPRQCPDLIWPVNDLVPRQVRINSMSRVWLGGPGMSVDRLHPHPSHQGAYVGASHRKTVCTQQLFEHPATGKRMF